MIALCVRAVNGRFFKTGIAYAEKLISQKPDLPDGHLLLGQALFQAELAKFQGTEIGVKSTLEPKNLLRAESALSRVIELVKPLGDFAPARESQGIAFLVRHQVRFLLGEREASDADLEEAWKLQPKDPEVLLSRAVAVRSYDKKLALRYLDEATHLGAVERVRFMRGILLSSCDRQDEGVAELLALIGAGGPFASEALVALVQIYVQQGLLAEADELLVKSHISVGSRKALIAYLDFEKGDRTSAAANALEAIRLLGSQDIPDVRRLLANVLHELEFFEQAFVLYDSFVVRGVDSPDFKALLTSAYLAGRHDFVLAACSLFSQQGIVDKFYLSLQFQVLQVYAPQQALDFLEKTIGQLPDDEEIRFWFAFTALRIGEKGRAISVLAARPVPLAQSASVDMASIISGVLLEIDRAEEAVTFVYDFLRTHWDIEGAHSLYAMTLMKAPNSRGAAANEVVAGMAALYEDQKGDESWIVMESEHTAAQTSLFEATRHTDLGSLFYGKKKGDKFQISAGIEPRTVEIVEIVTKYSYRLRDVMSNFQKRFPSSNFVQAFRSPDDLDDFISVGSPLFRAVVARHDHFTKVTKSYKTGMLNIYGASQALALNPIECQLEFALSSTGVNCMIPSGEFANLALTQLAKRDELFVDVSAMATVIMLDLLSLVSEWPWRLITTNSCIDVLRSFIANMRDKRESVSLGFANGMLAVSAPASSYRSEMAARAERLEKILVVVDALPLATVSATLRRQLDQSFGRWGSESIACGTQTNRILWTDDVIMAHAAVRQGGIVASSQIVTSALRGRECITLTQAFELLRHMFISSYEPMAISDDFVRFLISSANWRVDSPVFASLCEKLARMNSAQWFRFARILISEIMLNLVLAESRSAAIVAILETRRERSDCRRVVQTLLSCTREMFSLHAARESEFGELVDAWLLQL